MDRCDFSSIMTILRSYIRENNQLNQSEFLYEVFDDFLSSPEGADFSFDNGLVCRWMSGQAKVSPKLINYYSGHNRYLRTLREDTLLIIDNFNVTATQDSFLSVVMKYHCRILFTTRSKLGGYSLFPLTEISDSSTLFDLVSAFYPEASEHKSVVEEIIETVHRHTFSVELAAKLLNNGILSPTQLLKKLQEEKATLENDDNIQIIKDGRSNKATYYHHIHTLFSLYTLSEFQQNLMANMCFLPPSGLSARIFAHWMKLSNLNEINDLIETGFVQENTRHTISLHPMIQEIALSETEPSVTGCRTLLNSLQQICLMHGVEVDYYKKMFQTIENIIELIDKDAIPDYLLFLENVFPYIHNYNYQKGMKSIIQELKRILKGKDTGTVADRALLLDFQATLEVKPEKAMKLQKNALSLFNEVTEENAHLVSNLHANLGGLYRINGYPDLAREHMEESLLLLERYNLLYTNDSIPQITNYAMLLTEQQEPEKGISILQKLLKVIKKYNSDGCLDYATVQESIGIIYLLTANLPQAKIHFKKALKIYEKVWADDPEMIESKYQEIQELYPQMGIALAKGMLSSNLK